MDINPIYKFMKDNGLTQKDEATFVSEYSNPQKSAELHKFMTDNGLTTKGADDFYNQYFAASKKKGVTTQDSGQPGKPSAPSFGQKVINNALVSGEPVMKGVKKQPTEKKPYQDITYRREEMPSETTQMPETPIIKAAKKDFKQTVVKPQAKLPSTPEQLEEIEKKTETFDKDNLTLNNYQSSADIVNDLEDLYDEDVNVVYNRIQRRPDLYQKYSGRSINEAPSIDPANEQAWQERNKDRDVVYQNYLADLESQRNKHSVAAKQANELSNSILNKKITSETYKNYTSDKKETTILGEISAGPVVDMDKVDEEAVAIAEKYNLPTDGEAWRLLKNNIKNKVAYEIRKPAALENFKANEPELYKKRQELFESGFTFDDSTYAKVESELTGLQAQYEQDAKNEFNAIDAEYKSKAEALNSQYAQLNAATEAKQGELTRLYQSGQMDRLAYESAWGQLEDEKKLNHENYTKEFPSPEEYVRKSNEINSKYNRKFDVQKKSLVDKADAEIKAAYQKYASEYKEDPELLRQMNEAYSKAFEDAEMEALQKMGKASELSVIPLNTFYQSTMASLGGVFKGWGGSLDSKAFEMLGESMEQNFTMPAARTEDFSDWLRPQNLQMLSGQLAGSMIPSVAVTATATVLTGGSGIVPLVAGGLAGWGSETIDIVGRSYLDTFEKTNGNVVEANKAAERSLQSQYDLMWTYSLDALPFLKGSWLTKIPRAGARMAAGGAVELGTEFIQEYPQNIAEENISRGQDPWTNLGQALQDTDKMKQTLISIGPVAVLGAAGQVGSNSRKQQAIDRYVALQQKSELSGALPDQRRQYVQSMVFNKGSKFASGVVGALYANGTIDQDTAADMLMQVAKADKIRESGKEAGLKGDKLNIYGFYTARAEEAERNAAKFGNDPILSESYKQMAKQYRDAGLDFMKGGKPDLLTITYADKSQEFLMPEDVNALFANPAALASLNKKKISIEAYNDKGESIKVLDELKSRAETYASEKRYVAPVTRTSPLQAQRDAVQQRIQELDKQGPEMTAKERAKAIKDIEDQAAQQEKTSDQRDLEIEELQAKREALGVSEVDAFFSDMKPLVGTTVQRLEQGQNAPQSAIKVASDYLYAKYKELTAMKTDPNRMMTIAQIESIQAQIEQDLQTLEGNPPSQQTQENDQENVQGIPSEVGVGQEPVTTQPIEVTSEEAPTTGGVLQAQGQEEVELKLAELPTVTVEGEVVEATPTAETTAETKPQEQTELDQVRQRINAIEAARREGRILADEKPNELKQLKAREKELASQAAPKTEEKPKPTRKTRLAQLFETSEGEEAVPLIEQSLSESGIKVEVKDDADYNNDDRIKRSQGRGSEGMFVADDGTIILNRDKIKGEWGKTIVFHEGIHPVINIIRNTDPKRYKAIVEGLKAEAARNNDVARVAADIAASEEYQRRGPESIEDETVVETMARVATGDVNIDKFNPTFREKFIEFMNDIAKALGLKPVLTNSPRMEVQRLASQINKMLNEGGKISDIVGKKNVTKFQNALAQARLTSKEIAERTESKTKAGEVQPSMELTAKKNKQEVVTYSGPASIQALRENKPEMYVSRAIELSNTHLVKGITRKFSKTATPEQKLKWADSVYAKAKETVVSNLLFVYDNIDADVRNISKLWYDGANIIAQDMSSKYGVSLEQASAVIATQSPQKPWFDNVHLAHFILDFYANNKNTIFEQSDFDYYKSKTVDGTGKPYPKQIAYLPELQKAIGKPFSELSGYDKSAMIRARFDQNYERNAPLRIPTGAIVDAKIKSPSSFSGYETIAKAVSVIQDGSSQNISANIGNAYKVRNFYNNIASPQTDGEVTIDTHAMAVAYMLPLGSSSKEVKFDEGTYSFFADAYREAAKQRGVLAREMQSITWEGARAIFPANQKTEKAKKIVKDIWADYSDGKINLKEAQDKIKAYGKNLSITDWGGYVDEILDEDKTAAYLKELPLSSRGESAVGQRAEGTAGSGLPAVGKRGRKTVGQPSAVKRTGKYEALPGAPTLKDATGPIAKLVDVAESYAKKFGIPYTRQAEYVQVDEAFAKRIAKAYEEMKHDPKDPKVKEAYDDLIRQTTDQYNALTEAGYEFTFFDGETDPYNGNPVDAMRDLRANKKMAVYGTYAGYGTGSELNIGLEDPAGGPSLSVDEVLKAVKKAGGEVISSSVYASDTEPTLVVKLKTKLDDKSANKLSTDLGQESIAQRFDDETGKIHGPQAEKWGEFDPKFFITSDGRRASETSNPMLEDTGLQWPDQNGEMHKVTANDLFRAVHDAFGHGLEGAAFRARGEENAWQAHARLFTGPAVAAITTETRGQNSWLNYGPYGEQNRRAKVEDTIFAEQKTGLMPEWTWTENVAPPMEESKEGVKGQPSMMKRTPAQIRQAVEDGVDAVEEAIADGMDPQQAVDENVSSQDWYGDLSAAQKQQLNEILQDEFGATASEPKATTPVGEQIASIVDNYYKLKDGDRSARAAINEILGRDPKLKYIYDNISKINKQLQDAGVITDKTDGCP